MKVDSFDPTIPQAKIEDLRKRLKFQEDDELTSPFEGSRERFGENIISTHALLFVILTLLPPLPQV